MLPSAASRLALLTIHPGAAFNTAAIPSNSAPFPTTATAPIRSVADASDSGDIAMKSAKKPSANPKRAVLYIRVSTDEQHLSPEGQRADMAAYCEAQGLTIMATHEDLGVSGTTSVAERPGLGAALAAVRDHRAGVLLVAKRDRLARDPMIAAIVDSLCSGMGARVVSTAGEGTSDDSPGSVFIRGIMDLIAQHEVMTTRLRVKTALRVKHARNERTGSIAIGHTLKPDGKHVMDKAKGKPKCDGRDCPGCLHLQPRRDMIEAARVAQGLISGGLPLRTVAARLDAAGFVLTEGKAWHYEQVRRLVVTMSPYLGVAA